MSNSFEGLVARGFSEGARALLAARPELAVLAVPAPAADPLPDYGIAELDFHRIEGGLLVEDGRFAAGGKRRGHCWHSDSR